MQFLKISFIYIFKSKVRLEVEISFLSFGSISVRNSTINYTVGMTIVCQWRIGKSRQQITKLLETQFFIDS